MGEVLFFGCMAVVFYVYLGYPLAVLLLSRIGPRRVARDSCLPTVSIVIAAHNEEKCVAGTIENKLDLDYPAEKMEIFVISDGSTDRTDAVIRPYHESGRVRFIRQEPRAGKTAALNRAVPLTNGEILLFSDANSLYARDALKKLVRNFADAGVGYVTGKMIYTDAEGSVAGGGCSAYMRYENFLREQETRVGSVVGVNGGIDAVRKELYRPMAHDQLPDFVLPLRVVEQGFRVVYEPEALLKETLLKSTDDEYRMRVRVALRALWALKDMRQLLNFRRDRVFSWQLWSHKAMRYMCPLFLIGLFAGNLLLLNDNYLYRLFFSLQAGSYATVLLSALSHRQFPGIIRLLNYFVLINAAALHAFVRFLAGSKQVIWEPRKG